MSPTELAYRKTAAGDASGFGLLIGLYDTLAGDLRRAAEAERSNNIEKRCMEANHALLVIGHLEDWVHRGPGGELANHLIAFYSSLRRKLLEAQAKRSPEVLEELMVKVLEIRGVWMGVELRLPSTTIQMPARSHAAVSHYPGASQSHHERRSYSWSA
jgi:flagellar protein FliS